MEKSAARILKSSEVKLNGVFHLEDNFNRKPATGESKAVRVQARIVESQPQFAVIEVVCGCGAKTHIRCDYKTPTQSQG